MTIKIGDVVTWRTGGRNSNILGIANCQVVRLERVLHQDGREVDGAVLNHRIWPRKDMAADLKDVYIEGAA